ncbi:MAG: TrmB family transcriptional regulator [Cetobacterium sp.]|uniref:TrmB family transcriptional regulator n=1 Tax=Cetobacterium sp. TaxID=2071632 RepID=UPI003F3C726D
MIKIEEIFENLKKLGLDKKEAEVFLEIIKNPGFNGSQIAKILGYPRTTVYQNLDILQKKGYVNSYLDKEITLYEANNLEDLLENCKKDVCSATNFLKNELTKIGVNGIQKQFYNLNSYSDIKEKFKYILKKAKNIVYINTNLDLIEFEKEFNYLKESNVRVVLFSFSDLNYTSMGLETYIRDSFNSKLTDTEKRIMVAVDSSYALIASNYEDHFGGTYSENKLLANIVMEHIKNDIHLMKLEEKYGKSINKTITLDF